MLTFTILLSALTCYVCAQQSAVVYLRDPSGGNTVEGNVTFTKTSKGIQIVGNIKGFSGAGKHGFHVHQLGHIAPGCTGTGGHFNPNKVNHGAPSDAVRHVGDLGNIEADSNGVANIDFLDNVIALEGEHCIIGRAIVVHEGEDDLGKGGNNDSLTTGNAGGRLACGVIGLLEEDSTVTSDARALRAALGTINSLLISASVIILTLSSF